MKQFRLGCTSFVAANDLVENARQMAHTVENVELVLFNVEGYGENFPTPRAIEELQMLALTHSLTFTIHLPAELAQQNQNVWMKNKRALESVRALNPLGYVAHLDGKIFLRDTSAQTIARWQHDARRALQQLIECVGDAARVCVENVEGWDAEYFTEIVMDARASRCVDVGHLWLQGLDPLAHLQKHFAQTRVIHLHGVHGRDHQSLQHIPDTQLFPVIEMLIHNEYRGVLTLEVFSRDDFERSHAAVTRALEHFT